MISESWKNAGPDQINAWNSMLAELATLPSAITGITPFVCYMLITGSEFLIADPLKLYFALECTVTATGRGNPGIPKVDFYDLFGSYCSDANISLAVDATPAQIMASNPVILKNFYFTKIAVTGYFFIKFNGYRLAIS